jgi:hypothetical protein
VNIPDEQLWEVFQTVYEPGSRGSFERAQRDQPDVLDGVRAVAEWARREALKEAAEIVKAEIERLELVRGTYSRAQRHSLGLVWAQLRAEGVTDEQ